MNLFNCRRVEYCPPYFESQCFEIKWHREQELIAWIEDNLSYRYYVGHTSVLDSNNAITRQIRAGFEDKKELSYFLLACPIL